jgi:DNA uptake protein ComE-like DNA-binding protein
MNATRWIALGLIACHAWALAGSNGAPPKAPKPPVDINSATRQQLKTLPGVGDREAERIIAGRPWHSKADLVAAKAVPEGVYVAIRRDIAAVQPGVTRSAR